MHYSKILILIFCFIGLLLLFGFQNNNTQILLQTIFDYSTKYSLIVKPRLVVTDSSKYSMYQKISKNYPVEISGYYFAHDSEVLPNKLLVNCPHAYIKSKNYCKNFDAYWDNGTKQPEGQVIVKEMDRFKGSNVYENPLVQFDTSKYPFKRLFIMYKQQLNSNKDNGWRYAIADLIQKKQIRILNSGLIQNCVTCHNKIQSDGILDAYQSFR